MIKTLEIVGFILLGIMVLSYVGALRPIVDAGISVVFWGCAGGALAIIMYRKFMKKRQEGVDGADAGL